MSAVRYGKLNRLLDLPYDAMYQITFQLASDPQNLFTWNVVRDEDYGFKLLEVSLINMLKGLENANCHQGHDRCFASFLLHADDEETDFTDIEENIDWDTHDDNHRWTYSGGKVYDKNRKMMKLELQVIFTEFNTDGEIVEKELEFEIDSYNIVPLRR